jgi:hypothetical protein
MPSKQSWIGAAAGAAVATTVLVSVYEGKVLLANEHGGTTLVAGEQASVSRGVAPGAAQERPAALAESTSAGAPQKDASREDLLARDRAQRQELEQLRKQVRDLQSSADDDHDWSTMRPGDQGFFAPSKQALKQMADKCALKYDRPQIGFEPEKLSPKLADKAGLSPEQRTAVDRVTTDVNNRVVGQLRTLYVEVTGDAAGADSLTPRALEEEILSKSSRQSVQQAHYQLSHERAGLLPAADPHGESPAERLLRMMTGLGDQYERELAQAIGADRAHALRAQQDGWGSKFSSSGGCPGDKDSDDP